MSISGQKMTHFPLLLGIIRMFLENTKLFTFTFRSQACNFIK